mgnify:CR=1 FL=1
MRATFRSILQAKFAVREEPDGEAGWEALLVGLIVVTFAVGQSLSSEFLTADSFTTGSLDLSEVAQPLERDREPAVVADERAYQHFLGIDVMQLAPRSTDSIVAPHG